MTKSIKPLQSPECVNERNHMERKECRCRFFFFPPSNKSVRDVVRDKARGKWRMELILSQTISIKRKTCESTTKKNANKT